MSRVVMAWLFMVVVCLSAVDAPAEVLLSESFDGADGSQPTDWVAQTTGGLVSGNDGAGEYEQRQTGADGTAVAAFLNLDAVDQGQWRDVTAETNTRFSGGADNDNGLILRVRNLNGTGGGDFYMLRIQNNDSIALFRANGATFTQLDTASTGGLSITNRRLEFSAANIAMPDTDHVRLIGTLYDTDNVTPLATIDFTDTSGDAITRAGGVGYRSYNNSGAATRSTFDNLLVTSNKPSLLFYDDYNDGAAIRMETFGPAGTVNSEKFAFSHGSTSQTSLALVDFDSATPAWRDVEASALMRLNSIGSSSQIAPGLVLRETDVASNVTGEAGSFYLYRLTRQESNNTFAAQLLRKDGADGFDFLQSISLTADQVPESVNIYLKFSAFNEPGGVRLKGMASLNQDFSDAFGLIDFLDNSADAILNGGSAGFRAFGVGTSNFDNFTVTMIPEPATVGLLAVGFAALARRRRANRC